MSEEIRERTIFKILRNICLVFTIIGSFLLFMGLGGFGMTSGFDFNLIFLGLSIITTSFLLQMVLFRPLPPPQYENISIINSSP